VLGCQTTSNYPPILNKLSSLTHGPSTRGIGFLKGQLKIRRKSRQLASPGGLAVLDIANLMTTDRRNSLSRLQLAAILGLIALALIPRLVRAQYGLPYVDYWDEAQIASTSQRMLSEPEFFTTFFNYGNLSIYFAVLLGLPIFLFFHAEGHALAPEDLMPHPDYPWGFEYGEFLLAARIGWALLGVLTVVAVFLVARLFTGFWPAIFAGAALAVNPSHLVLTTRIPPDGLAAAIAFGAAGLAVTYLWKSNPALLYGSVVLGALAAATKYNYGTVVFAAVVAYVASSGSQDWKARIVTLVKLGVTAGLAFAIAMPSALAHPRLFVGAVLYEVDHYQTGHPGHESNPWLGQITFQTEALLANWGLVALVLSVIGITGLLFFDGSFGRRTVAVLTIPYIPFLLVMLSGTVNFHRNYLLIYPVIGLFAGIGMAYLVRFFQRVLGARPLSLAFQVLATATLFVMALLPNATSMISGTMSFSQGQDSRSDLVDFMKNENICERYPVALLEERLFLNQREWFEACPNTKLQPFEEGNFDFEKISEPMLVLGIQGLTGLQNPAFEINPGGNYAERDGNAFGPNFSPPIAVYLLNGP